MSIYNKDMLKYLSSSKWKEKRKEMFSYDDTCLICGTKEDLEIHHNTYEHFENERDGELEVMCKSCHRKVHKAKSFDMRNNLILDNDILINYSIKSISKTKKEFKEKLKQQGFYRKKEFNNYFTLIDLRDIKRLSKYETGIYLLVQMHKNTGMCIRTVSDLKKFFGMSGTTNDLTKYLYPAIDKLNKAQELEIKYQETKKGKKISSIKLTFKKQQLKSTK